MAGVGPAVKIHWPSSCPGQSEAPEMTPEPADGLDIDSRGTKSPSEKKCGSNQASDEFRAIECSGLSLLGPSTGGGGPFGITFRLGRLLIAASKAGTYRCQRIPWVEQRWMSSIQIAKDAVKRPLRLLEYEPRHLEGVAKLCARVHGESAVEGFLGRLRWVDALPSSKEPPLRYVLARGDEIVGFLAFVPMRYQVGKEVLIAHTPAEYMVRRDHRFHGIRLMRESLQHFPDCISCDDVEATIKVSELLGFERVAPVVRYSKALDARVVLERVGMSWAHRKLHRPISLAMATLDEMRSHSTRSIRVGRAFRFDSRFDELYESCLGQEGISVAGDATFLNWRYGDLSPHASRKIGVIEEGKKLRGYVVFHRSRRPGDIGRVLDLRVRHQEDLDAYLSLLGYAVSGLRELGARVAWLHRLAAGKSLPKSLLRELGFRPRGELWLMVRLDKERHSRIAKDPDLWAFSFGDFEASFAGR